MNRTYTLRRHDLVEHPAVTYVNITRVVGGELYFKNSKVESLILDLNSIEDCYISILSSEETDVVLHFTQSYNGKHYSKEESTTTFRFPADLPECILETDEKPIYLEYLMREIDIVPVYTELISKGYCDKVFYVTPIYIDNLLPDRYKYLKGSLSFYHPSGGKLFMKTTEGITMSYSSDIPVSDISEVYLVTPYNPIQDSIVIKTNTDDIVIDIEELPRYDYEPILTLLKNAGTGHP